MGKLDIIFLVSTYQVIIKQIYILIKDNGFEITMYICLGNLPLLLNTINNKEQSHTNQNKPICQPIDWYW